MTNFFSLCLKLSKVFFRNNSLKNKQFFFLQTYWWSVIFFLSVLHFASKLIKIQAEIGRHMIGDREWEVYRVLLDEGDGSAVPRNRIEEAVWKMLMGWSDDH